MNPNDWELRDSVCSSNARQTSSSNNSPMLSRRISRAVQKEAARLLGVSPRVLNYKIQVLNIEWKTFRISVA